MSKVFSFKSSLVAIAVSSSIGLFGCGGGGGGSSPAADTPPVVVARPTISAPVDVTAIKQDCLTTYSTGNGYEVGSVFTALPINATVNDDYSISQSPWGSKEITGWSLCAGAVMAEANSVAARITWDYGTNTTAGRYIKSYPNISYGNVPGDTTPVISNLPITTTTQSPIIASWDVSKTVSNGSTGNIAFDIWFSSDGKSSSVVLGQSTTSLEMMIWVDSWGEFEVNKQLNWLSQGFMNTTWHKTVTIDGTQWLVKYTKAGGMVGAIVAPVANIVFQAMTPIVKGSLDIMKLVQYTKEQGITNVNYIENIEFGSELADGKGDLRINSFAVDFK